MQTDEARMKISQSNSILIVGGGATGLETAGQIAEKYPAKKVGIVSRGQKLLI